MSNKTYDALKWVAQVLLPAIGTLYFALAAMWGLPHPQEVVGSIMAVDAFLGTLLHISSKTYAAEYDGTVTHIAGDNVEPALHFQLPDAETINGLNQIVLKVNKDK